MSSISTRMHSVMNSHNKQRNVQSQKKIDGKKEYRNYRQNCTEEKIQRELHKILQQIPSVSLIACANYAGYSLHLPRRLVTFHLQPEGSVHVDII